MKKILSFTLALFAISTMAFAAKQSESITVDCGVQVKMTATGINGYHFIQWSDGVLDSVRYVTPTKDTTVKALFAINEYTILFKNWNDTLLQQQDLKHGDIVTYTGTPNPPTKTGNAQYTFTFAGWNPSIVSPAVGNATYIAQFDTTINKYTITFKNYDGNVLQSSDWEYGQTPEYSGATPTKPATAEWTYTFKGWSPAIASVTAAAEYVAQYDSTKNSYKITVLPNDSSFGSVTGTGTYTYGKVVTIKANPSTCYRFVKWEDGSTEATRDITVIGEATYTAIFEKIQYKVTVESDDDQKGTAKVEEVKP